MTLVNSPRHPACVQDRDGGGGLGGLGVGGGGAGSLGGLSFMTASRRQVHPPQQVVEARVVAEKAGVYRKQQSRCSSTGFEDQACHQMRSTSRNRSKCYWVLILISVF